MSSVVAIIQKVIRPELFPTNLGDKVAAVAQPIARVIDRVAGTNVQGCGGCKKRQDALNAMTKPK